MDRELSPTQRDDSRDERIVTKDDSIACQKPQENQDSGSQQTKDRQEESLEDFTNLAYVLWRTVNHYFPHLNDWFDQMKDPRDPELITYEARTLIWVTLVMFLTKREARRKIRDQMRTETFLQGLKQYCEQENLKRVPHDDTVKYLFVRMNPEGFEELLSKMMRRLFRKKVFERFKLLGKYYTIAIDGLHTGSFHYEHCPRCLSKTEKGKTLWYHYKVAASLVCPNGMSLPLASEWVENTDGKAKQDSEQNAAKRLLKKLRRFYPKLPVCVLLDALYCGEPMFQALEAQRMEWMVVFKEGAMPEVYTWLMQWIERHDELEVSQKKEAKQIPVKNPRTHEERLMRNKPQNEMRTVLYTGEYGFAKELSHWNNERKYNLLKGKVTYDNQIKCDYTWLLSNKLAEALNKNTVEEMVDYGGRCRWKIENEGNNIQKNGGYNLEHAYIKDEVGMKIMHTLLDMAHAINQLMEKGSLIAIESYGAIRDIAMFLFEHMRYLTFQKPPQPRRIQIRLSWDTS